jgi:hypothetical protein
MTTVVTSRELRCGAGAVGKGREILDVTRDVELKNYHSIRNDGTQYLRKAKKKTQKSVKLKEIKSHKVHERYTSGFNPFPADVGNKRHLSSAPKSHFCNLTEN